MQLKQTYLTMEKMTSHIVFMIDLVFQIKHKNEHKHIDK